MLIPNTIKHNFILGLNPIKISMFDRWICVFLLDVLDPQGAPPQKM